MSVRKASQPTPAPPQATPEQLIRSNGAELCVQGFGDPDHPAILLIAGGGGSMLDWPEEFCARLAAGSRFVIRYDHRDTGRSTTYPPGAPGYTGRDLDEDAIGILDALGVTAAHLVGMSMGGGISQELATRHPDRVASLTLISTTSIADDPDGPDLPAPSPEVVATFSATPPEAGDRAALIDYVAAQYRPFTSTSRPVAETYLRDLARRIVDRSISVASMNNHFIAASPERTTREQLAGVTAPTLVIHGTEDPLMPHSHGVALADAIPGAWLLTLEHTGHELPPAVWDTAIPAILQHTTP